MAELTKQALRVENNTEFPNNNNGQITPSRLRTFNEDMIDSTVNQAQYTTDSGSWNQQIDALESFSSSLDTNFASQAEFNSYTSSNNQRVSSLEAATSSYATSAITASSLITASFAAGTLTFTKGNGTTFGVVIPDVSGSTINTGSFATTGSNSFNGNQTITGSVTISGSAATDLTVVGAMTITGSTAAARTTITSGSVTVTNSPFFSLINPGNGIFSGFGGTQFQQIALENDEGTIVLSVDANGSYIRDYNPTLGDYSNAIKFQPYSNYGVGQVQVLRSLEVTGSLGISGNLTSSLQQGYVWVGNASGRTTTVATSSFGSTIDTGSFATTGSNTFTGDQTLIDAAGNTVTLSDASGSLMLVAKTFTSASTHLTASAGNQVNLIFKNNNNTADTIISGSNNIFTNPSAPTADYKRIIGSNNIVNSATGIPQVTGSMGTPITMASNYFGTGTTTIRGPITGSGYTISNNSVVGTLNIGQPGVNDMTRVSALSLTGNQVIGTMTIAASTSTTLPNIVSTATVTSNIVNGAMQATMNSSSVTMTNNIINAGSFIIANNHFTTGAGSGSLSITSNLIGGAQFTNLTVQGANPVGTTNNPAFNGNIMYGISNAAHINADNARTSSTNAYTSLLSTAVFGSNLAITGSSLGTDTATVGSAFVGRFNANDGIRNRTSNVVFAVGTGTSAAGRKTGFLIDSGSNTFVEGTLNVSGSTVITGSTPSLTIGGTAGNTVLFPDSLSISSSLYRNLQGPRGIALNKLGFDYPVFNSLYSAQSSSFLYNYTDNLSGTASYNVGVFDNAFTQDVELYLETTTTNGVQFKDIDGNSGITQTFLRIAPNYGSNPPLEFKRGMQITGSLSIQSGSSFFANGNKQFNVGAFSSLVSQSGSANVSQSMNFETTDISSGVSIVSNSQITLANSGTYNIQFSAQVLADTGADDVYIWLKKNGTNVAASAGHSLLSNNEEQIVSWNYVVDAVANDYYEIAWQSTQGDAILLAEAASGNIPSIPSVILTVTQVK